MPPSVACSVVKMSLIDSPSACAFSRSMLTIDQTALVRAEGRENLLNSFADRGWPSPPAPRQQRRLHGGRILALERLQLVFEAAAGGQADDRRQVEGDDVGRALIDARTAPNTRPIAVWTLSAGRAAVGERLHPHHQEGELFDWLPPSSSEKPTIDSTLCTAGLPWCSACLDRPGGRLSAAR